MLTKLKSRLCYMYVADSATGYGASDMTRHLRVTSKASASRRAQKHTEE